MTSEISEEEGFSLAYRVFWDAVNMLAQNAVTQCNMMGNYNVAWELKSDISAGSYLTKSNSSSLSQEQKSGIDNLIEALASVPDSVLISAKSASANLSAMNHLCWEPLRAQASELLELLPTPSN